MCELYAYYARTEPMFSNVLRDLELVSAIQPAIGPFVDYLAEAAEVLADGWPARGRRRRVLDASLRYALEFNTWRSLAGDNPVTRTEAVQLVTALVWAAAAPPRRAPVSQIEAENEDTRPVTRNAVGICPHAWWGAHGCRTADPLPRAVGARRAGAAEEAAGMTSSGTEAVGPPARLQGFTG